MGTWKIYVTINSLIPLFSLEVRNTEYKDKRRCVLCSNLENNYYKISLVLVVCIVGCGAVVSFLRVLLRYQY